MRVAGPSIVFVISLGGSLIAGADPLCPNLLPDHGHLGFRPRTNGDRCEGFFRSQVSGEPLSLAFLLSGHLPDSGDVEVKCEGSNPQVQVRAVALPLGTYYRMDATISPGKPLRWPLSDVVVASHSLKSADLGVYGWLGDANRPTFVPVRVTSPGGVAAESDRSVRLGMRANVSLDLIVYNVAAYDQTRDDSCHFGDKPWKQLASNVRPGMVLSLPIPRDQPGVCVGFRAKLPDANGWEPFTAKIHLR